MKTASRRRSSAARPPAPCGAVRWVKVPAAARPAGGPAPARRRCRPRKRPVAAQLRERVDFGVVLGVEAQRRQEALARGWDAAGLLGRGQPRTPQQGLTAPRLLIREFQSPEALAAALIAAPPCANHVPVLLCADDLPCRQSGGTTLQDWRQAMSPVRPRQEARSSQLVVVYGQDHWRTASAIRTTAKPAKGISRTMPGIR